MVNKLFAQTFYPLHHPHIYRVFQKVMHLFSVKKNWHILSGIPNALKRCQQPIKKYIIRARTVKPQNENRHSCRPSPLQSNYNIIKDKYGWIQCN